MNLNCRNFVLSLFCFLLLAAHLLIAQNLQKNVRSEFFTSWELEELLPNGRFDAIANLDGGVFLIGSRGHENHGKIFRSEDYGDTWNEVSNTIEDEITCIANGGTGISYLLTGTSLFYVSKDYGLTWSFHGKVSPYKRFGHFKLSYGISVTSTGAILVSDTDPDGGHVFRSTDKGETWTDLGRISPHALYRFEQMEGQILVNGWEGAVYGSVDDGLSWTTVQALENGPLYATEHLEDGSFFQASESGHIYRGEFEGDEWLMVGRVAESADDFVRLGPEKILLSTYTKTKHLYLSDDSGESWHSLGTVNPAVPQDWLDHVISYEYDGAWWLLGCTNRGYVVRAQVRD